MSDVDKITETLVLDFLDPDIADLAKFVGEHIDCEDFTDAEVGEAVFAVKSLLTTIAEQLRASVDGDHR